MFALLMADGSASGHARNVALVGAVVLLFTALTLIHRAFAPLRVIVLPVIAGAVGVTLVFAAFVLLLIAVFPHG